MIYIFMKKLIPLFISFQLGALGFSLSTGPGYRQDRFDSEGEVFPHLRMFDWMLAFDASTGPFHLSGEGDMGWFSCQAMRKSTRDVFPVPLSFSYVTSGRAVTGSLYGGYQFGQRTKAYLMPLAGWFYNSTRFHSTQPIPPFQPIGSAFASIEITSNETQAWEGPILGATLGWQPVHILRLTAFYAYGWLRFHHAFSELYTLDSEQTPIHGAPSASGHGNLAAAQTILLLSPNLSLDANFRYFSLQSAAASLTSYTLSGSLSFRF